MYRKAYSKAGLEPQAIRDQPGAILGGQTCMERPPYMVCGSSLALE